MSAYEITLAIHNITRWAVLIFGLYAIYRAVLGWLGKREWASSDRVAGLLFGISMDVQLLLGLLLYFVFSPITRAAMQDFSSAMGVADLRFFAVEHLFFMVLAVVFVHLGSALARRASDSVTRHKRAAIFFGLALVLVFMGIPWARPLLPGLGGA